MTRIQVPKFNSEEEEANWWYDNREEHARIMAEAFERGETTTLAKLLERRTKETGVSYEHLQKMLREEAEIRKEQRKAS
jgi:hypothetical protein